MKATDFVSEDYAHYISFKDKLCRDVNIACEKWLRKRGLSYSWVDSLNNAKVAGAKARILKQAKKNSKLSDE